MRKDRFMIAPFILATKKYKKLKIGRTYGPAARKAWLGLVNQLDARANVTDVCVGTNKANAEVGANRDVQLKYYLDRPRRTGDLHAQAPLMWSATTLMR
jgi:rhamnogalacturonyl hydrolase YesR